MPGKNNPSKSDARPDPRKRTARGEQTRQQIIAASIVCLNRFGYAGTSIEAVMEEAGLSRGSVLNQFPTRLALMIGVIEASLAIMLNDAARRASLIADPVDRVRGICDVFWETMTLPAATVMTEVLLASRWDDSLATALRPAGNQIHQEIVRYVVELSAGAGMSEAHYEANLVHAYVLMLSLRGIALELMHSPDGTVIYKALEQVKAIHQAHCDKVLARIG